MSTSTATTAQPLAGFGVQLVLLAALAATTGLSPLGWLAGAAYGAVLCGLLARALRRAGLAGLGWANLVTFGRALLTGGVTALVVTSFARPVPTALLVTLAAVTLAMDGVDGQVARRTGTSTPLGARFDMEVDAYLILALSIAAAAEFGWWVVALGVFRYAFVAASWALPWLNSALPPRFSRKVVAAEQGILLVVALSGLLAYALGFALMVLALASLTWSFGRDIPGLDLAREVRVAARRRWSAAARAHALAR